MSFFFNALTVKILVVCIEKPGSLSSIPASIQTKNNQFASTTPASTPAETSSDIASTSATANFVTSQES